MRRRRRWWPSFGLAYKLALFTGLLLTLTTATTVVVNSLREEERLKVRLVERACALSSLLARFTASYQHDLRLDELKVVLEDVLAQGTVSYGYVLDADDTVIVDGLDDARVFETVVDPLADLAQTARAVQLSWDPERLHVAEPVSFSDGTVGAVRVALPLAPIHEDIAALRRSNLIIGAGIGCAALGLSLLLAQRVTRPLHALSAATERVARGDLSSKVTCRSDDELGLLAASFNQMVDRLESSAKEIHKLAYSDPLTALANRHRFRLDLASRLAVARAGGGQLAVLCLDLDHFKEVNDTLGHAAGDTLLQLVAERLSGELEQDDGLARLGGDEFAILCSRAQDHAGLQDLCAKLVDAVAAPFDLGGHEVAVRVSVGVALFPHDGQDPGGLMKSADLALYRAKAEGRNGFRFFEVVMRARLQARKALEQDLRHALARDELELHFQPQVELATGRMVGAEALMRWRHPGRGLVPPSEFITLAEETGLINELGGWALLAGCREAATWPHGRVAINISPVQFRQPTLVKQVEDALLLSGLPAERLEVEITEGVLLRDSQETLAALEAIRALGVRIALDDFGTGYSSLSYLRRFAFYKIKIDRSFVLGLGRNREARAIVAAIVELSQSLGMRATAEGVETMEEKAVLRRLGCDEAQGYLFGRPCAAPDFRALLEHETVHEAA